MLNGFKAAAALVALVLSSATSAAPDLTEAIRANDLAGIEAALAAGADPGAVDGWNRTPLLTATQLRNTEAVRALVASGRAKVDVANKNDITPLIAAAQSNNVEAARLLLEAGANPNLRDNMGWSALTWAKNRKFDEMAALLVAKGANDAAPPPAATPRATRRANFAPVLDPGRAILGDARAPVTIYEYTDLQCPYCKAAADTLATILPRYEGEVRLVVKHLPLPDIHPQAMAAARYFEAVALQDPKKAFDFSDRVFRAQGQLRAGGEALVAKLAAESGADPARLQSDLASPAIDARVMRDMDESRRLDIQGVPVFVIGGEVIEGAQPAQAYVAAIEAARRK